MHPKQPQTSLSRRNQMKADDLRPLPSAPSSPLPARTSVLPAPSASPARTSVLQAPASAPKYLSRKHLARILNVSVRKIDAMIALHQIPVIHLGRMVRFRLEDVERHLEQTILPNHPRPLPHSSPPPAPASATPARPSAPINHTLSVSKPPVAVQKPSTVNNNHKHNHNQPPKKKG